MNYHSYFLNNIRKEIGASFVAFERNKDSYSLKVVKDGRTDLHPLTGSPDDVTPERYEEVSNQLKTLYNEQI